MQYDESYPGIHHILADRALEVVTGGLLTSFLATVGGQTEVTWTPRAYAVQSDLSGGVTGARRLV